MLMGIGLDLAMGGCLGPQNTDFLVLIAIATLIMSVDGKAKARKAHSYK
jgi:Ca2+/Na+ antiporter